MFNSINPFMLYDTFVILCSNFFFFIKDSNVIIVIMLIIIVIIIRMQKHLYIMLSILTLVLGYCEHGTSTLSYFSALFSLAFEKLIVNVLEFMMETNSDWVIWRSTSLKEQFSII